MALYLGGLVLAWLLCWFMRPRLIHSQWWGLFTVLVLFALWCGLVYLLTQ